MASKGINKVIIVGNLGTDPEVRMLPSGTPVTNINVATSEKWIDKQGNQVEHTEWHRIVFFNKLAEIAEKWLKKGSKVYVEGKLKTNKWQDKDGKDRYTTEIIANEMQMLGGDGGSQSNQQAEQPRPQVAEVQNNPEGFEDDFSDDIPF